MLMTIYKAFMRRHLDYGDVIYDEAYNETFHQKFEPIQYNTCLDLSEAITGSSREKLYQTLSKLYSNVDAGKEYFAYFIGF